MHKATFIPASLLIVTVFCFGLLPAHAQVLEQDSLALVAIYNATDGPNWRSNPQWLDRPVRDWGYLEVEGNRVVGLGLAQLELKGTLPPEIGDLTALRLLALEMNQLTGPIPEEIGNLTQLEYLSLFRNQFSGPVPASIGNLTKLGDLILWGNQLTSLPEEIGNLVGLTQLNVWENQLTNIPNRIGDLVNLIELNLLSNEITTPIPASIGNLSKLQYLDLSYNANLPGPLPSSIGNMTSLTKLYLYESGLDGPIPPEIGNLVNLERLRIFRTNLEGPIPATIGNLKLVWDMNLSQNNLSGPIPPELGDMVALEEVMLFQNHLSGTIPSELANLENVSSINLNDNDLEGAVPSSLANMPGLRGLNIENNNIEDLADFSNAPYSNFILRVKGNRLHFDDLQLNAGVNLGEYWPQQEIDVYATDTGNDWVLACGVGGTGNSYQWFYEDRTGASNNSQDSRLLVPKPVNNRYYCEAKNGQFVDLILTTWLWPQSSGGANQAPIASFTPSATSGTVPFVVTFDASASSDPEGGSLTYVWTFGDGGAGSGATPSHTFSTAGSYTVSLTVSDPEGATATATTTIVVRPPNTSDFSYLTGLWLVDDETGYDESANGHDGIYEGSPEVRVDPDYPDHHDLYFDGSSAVRIPDSPDFTSAEMTVAFWFRLDTVEGLQILASHAVTGEDSNAGWFFMATSGFVGVGIETVSGGLALTTPDPIIQAETWHAVAFTVGGGTAKFYVDGNLVDEEGAGLVKDPASDLFIGGDGTIISMGGGLKGFIDDFWIDDVIYSAEALRDEMGLPDQQEPLPADLIAWYRFDGDATEAVSGESISWSSWTEDRHGTPGSALYLPVESPLETSPFTASDAESDQISFGGWFRHDEGELYSTYVWTGSHVVDRGFRIIGPDRTGPEGYEVEIFGTGGTAYTEVRTGLLMESGRWFHLFSTHDGTRQRVYMNGMLVVTGNESPVGPFIARATGETLRWGGDDAMSVSDFRIYDRALSDTEVLDLAYEGRSLLEVSTADRTQGGSVFGADAGGFLFGTNAYGDLAKAEMVTLPSGKAQGTLAGIRIWMGYSFEPTSLVVPADVALVIWSGSAATGPQELLYQSPALKLTTDEVGPDYVNPLQAGPVPLSFALPDVKVPSEFFVAVHFAPYGNDFNKYAIMSGPQLGTAVPTVWEQWSDGQWASVSSAWFGGNDGAHMWIDAVEAVDGVQSVGIEPEEFVEASIPSGVDLLPAYPNPFNPITTIEYDVPSRMPVRISVMDMLGRAVATLVDGTVEAGRHQVRFDASGFASGVYMVHMQALSQVSTRTIVLLK